MSGTLCLVAHPDDETFGCGGTIAKWGDCSVVALADGVTSRNPLHGLTSDPEPYIIVPHKARHDAFKAAMAVLGVTRYASKGLPDQRLDAMDFLDLAKGVENIVAEYQPDRILTHHLGDLNKDHRLVAEAVLVACRPPNRCEILSFEVPSSTEWAYGMEPAFRPNVFVDVGGHWGKKTRAVMQYTAECRPLPHPRSVFALEYRARYWGQVAGCEYAEPFMLLRGYR